MEVSEQELNTEATDGETAEAPVQPEGEAGQEVFEGEAPETTRENEEKMEEEQGTQGEEVAQEEHEEHQELQENQENQEEDEGFELGGEEEGYFVHDETSEGGLQAELEDEGLEVAEEEKNDEWLLHPGNYFSQWLIPIIPNSFFCFVLFFLSPKPISSVKFTCLYYLDVEGTV